MPVKPHNSLLYRLCRTLLAVAATIGVVAEAGAADFFNGRNVYQQHCQSCHGANGQSLDAGMPDFSRGESLFASDIELFERIRGGVGAMPAYRGILEDEEIRDVIAYMRSLQK